MATKKLREENDHLRAEIEELKNQIHKVNEDLMTKTTAVLKSKTTGEVKREKNTTDKTSSEERNEAVAFMSKQYDDLEDIQQITKKVDSISKRCDEITESLEAIEQYSYQYNIKIMGVTDVSLQDIESH